MLSPRVSVAVWLTVAAVCFVSLVGHSRAEYDILQRFDVPRPEGGRHFWLYSPTGYQHSTSPSPLPLAMFFHGYTDTCELQGYISQFSIWAYVAEIRQYHIAVMCGTLPGPGWASGYRANTTGVPDDIAYTRASLAIIQKAVKVREGHVFAMGHSNGAAMSELLACNASDIINAIASNAGGAGLGPTLNQSIAYCDAGYRSNTTSILKLFGTADGGYNGSASSPGAVRDFQAWGARNRCQGAAQKQWTRGVASAQGWTSCAGGSEVQLVTLDSVNHQWMITSELQSSTYVFDFLRPRGASEAAAAEEAAASE